MPRARMIKPDFWNDEKLSSISLQARLVFIGLWNISDDYGVTKGNPVWIKNQLFPYGCAKTEDVTKWLHELEDKKFIYYFKDSGESYYYIKTFNKHQKVQHPSKQRNPEPPDEIKNNGYS
jgi:hypothetical protein